MFETLISSDRALARHRDGPLAEQRNRYLLHCADQGGTRDTLCLRARSILWIAEHMSPSDFGLVDASRLHEIVYGSDCQAKPAQTTAATLVSFARPWLKFLGWWPQVEEIIPFPHALENFVAWMRDERGLTQCTIDQWQYRTSKFLHCCSDTCRDLATLRPQYIDACFVTDGAHRWSHTYAGPISKKQPEYLRHASHPQVCSA